METFNILKMYQVFLKYEQLQSRGTERNMLRWKKKRLEKKNFGANGKHELPQTVSSGFLCSTSVCWEYITKIAAFSNDSCRTEQETNEAALCREESRKRTVWDIASATFISEWSSCFHTFQCYATCCTRKITKRANCGLFS